MRARECCGTDVLLTVLLVSLAVPLNLKLGGLLTVYTFDIALALMYGGWVVDLLRGTAPHPQLGPVDIAALVMLSWFVACAIIGLDPSSGLDTALSYIRMYLIYVYVANKVRTRRHIRYTAGLLLGLIALESLVGIAQYVTRSNIGSLPDLVGDGVNRIRSAIGEAGTQDVLFRVRGTLGHDVTLGYWFEILLPISIGLCLCSKDQRQRAVCFFLTVLGFAGLILTFTRGAWLGFAVAVTVLFLNLWGRSGHRIWRWRRLIPMAVVAGVLVLTVWKPVQLRLMPEDLWDSLSVRAPLNDRAMKLIRSSPVIGVGLDGFEQVERIVKLRRRETQLVRPVIKGVMLLPEWSKLDIYRALLDDDTLWGNRTYTAHKVHNLYLLIASETGLVGLGLFLLFLGVSAITLHQARQIEWALGSAVGSGLLAGLCGVLVHGFLDWGFLNYQVFPLFWALLGLAVSIRRRSWEAGEDSSGVTRAKEGPASGGFASPVGRRADEGEYGMGRRLPNRR